jgi:ubiquinone/menaquinone biosynthesis C-methylase UbiE
MPPRPPSDAPGASRWDAHAGAYGTPETLRGPDLDVALRVTRVRGTEHLVDVATGGGGAALAFGPSVARVTALDPSAAMVAGAVARLREAGVAAAGVQAEAGALPLADACCQLVTCRIAAHHFPDVPAALAEVRRILGPDGTLVLIDSLAPDGPAAAAFLDRVERQRDPTHVRSLTRAEWERALTRAGLLPVTVEQVRHTKEFERWLGRGGATPEDQARVRSQFLAAGREVVDALVIRRSGGRVASFADEKLVVRARRI